MDIKIFRKQFPQMQKEIAAVLDKYNLALVKMGGTIGSDDASIRLNVVEKGTDPYVKYAKDFSLYAELDGMKREWLNKKFLASNGGFFEIIGLNTRKRKNPVMVKKVSNGKIYFAPISMVISCMGKV